MRVPLIVVVALALQAVAGHAQQPRASATLEFVRSVTDAVVDDGESTTHRVCLNGGHIATILVGAPHPTGHIPPEVENESQKQAQEFLDRMWASAKIEFERHTFSDAAALVYPEHFDSQPLRHIAPADGQSWDALLIPGPGCLSLTVENGSLMLYHMDIRVVQ